MTVKVNFFNSGRNKIKALVVLLLLFSLSSGYASEVAVIKYVRGIATVINSQGSVSVLASGSPLSSGDEIHTGKRSFAILRFIDDSKMTIRPNSVFKIDKFNYQPKEPEKNSGIFSLFKGGLRMVTGFINKVYPNSMSLNAVTATIGIRGTEFDARICDKDCLGSKITKSKEKKASTQKAVGRVAFMRGQLTANNAFLDKVRKVSTGGPIYENDVLKTNSNSIAVIAFVDKSRITLRANSDLFIEQFRYKPKNAPENASVFHMLKGGMRFLTGLVGKLNRVATKIYTPTATIGIRGTGFDLLCVGNCGETKIKGEKNGMYVYVWNGAISLQKKTSLTFLETGQSVFLRDAESKPEVKNNLPDAIKKFNAPRPDKVDVDHQKLFGVGKVSAKQTEKSLFVTVYDGHVSVKNKQGEVTDIGAGESLVALNSGQVIRLDEPPKFQIFDDIPGPQSVDENELKMRDVFNIDGLGLERKILQCDLR